VKTLIVVSGLIALNCTLASVLISALNERSDLALLKAFSVAVTFLFSNALILRGAFRNL
jgi:hypothetical protein